MSQTKLGSLKCAAKRIGISLEEYLIFQSNNLKYCYQCRDWKSSESFNKDTTRADGRSATCRECAKERYNRYYIPKIRTKRPGPLPKPSEDGNKKQARHKVNKLVRNGDLENPNSLPCRDCGHIGDEKRHEYDHYLGYKAENHTDVEVVCSKCHSKRERDRILANRKLETKELSPNEEVTFTVIAEFPAYMIGSDGSIFSCWSSGGKKKITNVWKPKQIDWTNKNYGRIPLYDGNGNKKRKFLHHLVLECFVGARPDGYHACHINNDSRDNRLSNLKWDTPSNNYKEKFQ
jgi:hypothetical protein